MTRLKDKQKKLKINFRRKSKRLRQDPKIFKKVRQKKSRQKKSKKTTRKIVQIQLKITSAKI